MTATNNDGTNNDPITTAKDVASRGVCPYSGASTNVNGSPVSTEEHSATVGQQGPLLLSDVHLVEKHLSLIHI